MSEPRAGEGTAHEEEGDHRHDDGGDVTAHEEGRLPTHNYLTSGRDLVASATKRCYVLLVHKRCEKPHDQKLLVWTRLLETHSLLIERLEADLQARGGGLPIAWYDVLVQLKMSPGHRLTMRELSQAVLLSKSGITRLVDRMAREGLIEREPCPSDRRVVYARLTERGLAAFDQAAPVHVEAVRRRFSNLVTDEEAAVMGAALDRVLQAAADGTG